MATGFLQHPAFLDHDTGPTHPERPDRLRAVDRALDEAGWLGQVTAVDARPVDGDLLRRVHEAGYIERVRRMSAMGSGHLDSPDTPVSIGSERAAHLAAGGVVAACEAILAGSLRNAFCAVRPPGHHAERSRAMGFCLFNNVAIAAEHLIHSHGLERVAVVDFDVHHGNGTQHLFEERGDVLFISVHEHPLYQFPGTGFEEETGRGGGEGRTVNIPLTPGADDQVYQGVFERTVLPTLDAFRPQHVLISAGFDAAEEDPLGHMRLTSGMFRWMTAAIRSVAERHADGRVLSVLEGGYDLDGLGRGAAAHVEALVGEDSSE